MHGFGDVDAVLARGDRSAYHVHALQHRRHQPREHGGGQRPVVECRRVTLVLDRDAPDHSLACLGELPREAAEQPAELHVGLEARRVLGGNGRHVDRIRNGAREQEIAHLLGDLQRHVLLRLGRRRAEMRRADDVLEPEQRAVGRRLGFEHVERRAGDVAGFDRLRQRCLIDQAAARAIDDAHAGPGARQRLAREDVRAWRP